MYLNTCFGWALYVVIKLCNVSSLLKQQYSSFLSKLDLVPFLRSLPGSYLKDNYSNEISTDTDKFLITSRKTGQSQALGLLAPLLEPKEGPVCRRNIRWSQEGHESSMRKSGRPLFPVSSAPSCRGVDHGWQQRSDGSYPANPWTWESKNHRDLPSQHWWSGAPSDSSFRAFQGKVSHRFSHGRFAKEKGAGRISG